MRSRIRIRIKVKIWTRIRIKVKSWIRIRHPCQNQRGRERQEGHLCHLVRWENSGVLLDLKDGVDVDTRLVRATRPVLPFYLHKKPGVLHINTSTKMEITKNKNP